MNFQSIFIANIAEVARPLTQLMSRKRREYEILEDHYLCCRFLSSCEDNRILVTPYLLDQGLVKDTCSLLRFKNFVNFAPKNIKESTCQAVLKDNQLLKALVEVIKKNPLIDIKSYAATSEFKELIEFFRKKGLVFKTSEMPEKEKVWTASFFDSKAGFRQAMANLPKDLLPMPEGVICSNFQEAIGWAKYFIGKKGGVVIKTNRGMAGAGLKIIRKKDLKGQNLDFFFRNLFESELFWQKEPIIIEEFIPPELRVGGGAPNIELRIINNKVKVLYVCGMRISKEGVFKGAELGKSALPENIVCNLIKTATSFGAFIKKLGYQGFFELDFVYGKNKKLYSLEANLRRTGGTHAFELAKRLLGKNFESNYYLIAVNIVRTKKLKGGNYQFLEEKLSSVLYPIRGKKEGVILTIANYVIKDYLGYVVVGPNKKRVYQIEEEFLKFIN